MALFRSLGARKDAVRGTTALEVRKGLAGLFTGAGVLPGADAPLVTGTAGWAYSVGKAGFVSTRGASDGVHLYGNDGTVTIGTTGVGSTVPEAPGAGLSRIDIMWVKQQSASENSDTVSDAIFGVASGTPGAPGLPPSIPTGALELARNAMTSAATSTASTGNTITQTAAAASLRVPPIPTWTSFTPTLGSIGGTAPTLGTGGFVNGSHRSDGVTCEFLARVVFGTSPSAGSGAYILGVPFTLSPVYPEIPFIAQYAIAATAVKHRMTAELNPNTNYLVFRDSATIYAWGPTWPAAPAAGDVLIVRGSFPI